MAVIWIFNKNSNPGFKPAINGQLENLSTDTLTLRNPWVSDSVFMAKLYTAMTLALAIFFYPDIADPEYIPILLERAESVMQYIFAPLIFTPFLAYRIYFIKKLSNFHFSRSTQKILYQRGRKLITFDWNQTHGGVFKRTEFGGSSFSTSYALAFAPPREDGSLHQKDCLWVDSNEPTESDIKHVAEVWEYLRHFMNHGP
ncbi:hypothetical protein, partial [Pseudomonas entomophila]|uniref:hypothetical protein n=1 Tax=Pseudomonas entomophila TaxID=312306 RepID=UPI001F0042C1